MLNDTFSVMRQFEGFLNTVFTDWQKTSPMINGYKIPFLMSLCAKESLCAHLPNELTRLLVLTQQAKSPKKVSFGQHKTLKSAWPTWLPWLEKIGKLRLFWGDFCLLCMLHVQLQAAINFALTLIEQSFLTGNEEEDLASK